MVVDRLSSRTTRGVPIEVATVILRFAPNDESGVIVLNLFPSEAERQRRRLWARPWRIPAWPSSFGYPFGGARLVKAAEDSLRKIGAWARNGRHMVKPILPIVR